MATTLDLLSSEVLLRVLGYLDEARDLTRVRQVSRRLCSVGGDAMLWRNLFICTYLRSSAHAASKHQGRPLKRSRLSDFDSPDGRSMASARAIKGLPMVGLGLDRWEGGGREEDDRKVDWYTLFKVSRNWQTGNFTSRSLQTIEDKSQKTQDPTAGPSRLADSTRNGPLMPQTLIDSSQSYVFTTLHSGSDGESSPALLVFPSESSAASTGDDRQESLARYQSTVLASKGLPNVRITSLAVDRRGPIEGRIRLFLGYSNGDSCMLRFDTVTHRFHDEGFIDAGALDVVVAAALHSPLLVTCTADFKIRVYRTDESSTKFIEERRTYSCHWPATLRLDRLEGSGGKEGGESVRLTIAYASPVYPIGWTVGLQEIILGTQSSLLSRSAIARRAHITTRLDSPSKQDRRARFAAHRRTHDIDRRNQVGRLTSLSYEDPFIVVGTEDNDVVCFRVDGSVSTESGLASPAPLSLAHVCTFQGHTGTVHSVSLNEGRCVTGGSDGSVRIWRLGDEEAAVAKAAGLLTTIDASLRRGLGRVVTIGASLGSGKRKRADRDAVPLSLAEILRQTRHSQSSGADRLTTSSSSAVVRWVTSAFDQIISVSAVKTAVGTCRSEAAVEREEEQVQIWNFSR